MPLESVQFVVNIMFNRIVRKRPVTLRMVLGVSIVIAGIIVLVFFGPNEGSCFSEDQLRGFWLRPVWLVYLIVSFAIAAVMYVVWRLYGRASERGALGEFGRRA